MSARSQTQFPFHTFVMLTSLFYVCLALSALVSARPPALQDSGRPSAEKTFSLADLEGLTRNQKDCSGREVDEVGKYFHESSFDAHYDGRFACSSLPPGDRLVHLRALIRGYLRTMHSLNVETWIMHGSLLGWWWNLRIMPWDSDIDVQISEPALDFLAAYYNMTVYTFNDDDTATGEIATQPVTEERKYLLEINPHYKNSSIDDKLNVIDARWIDTTTGLYIDITALHVNRTQATRNITQASSLPSQTGLLYCKDNHHYNTTQIFPLRQTTFEGVPVKVPYAYQDLLVSEYGEKSLIDTVYHDENHMFDQEKEEWIPITREMGRQIRTKEHAAEVALKKAQREKEEGTWAGILPFSRLNPLNAR